MEGERGERWRVLRDDEDLGPGCYEIAVTSPGYGPHPAPPEGDSILVPRAELEEARREAADYLEQLEGRNCETCDGTGGVMRLDPNLASPDNPDGDYDDECPDCGGKGRTGGLAARLAEVEGALERLHRVNQAIERTGEPGPRSMESALRKTEQEFRAALSPDPRSEG